MAAKNIDFSQFNRAMAMTRPMAGGAAAAAPPTVTPLATFGPMASSSFLMPRS